MTTIVGFVGLGNMGSQMAVRLRDAGYTVLGYDVRLGLAEKLGLEAASTLAAVCEADTVLLSLPDSRVIEAAVMGAEGILAAARPGLLVADLSTANPSSTRKLQALMAAKGAEYVDAAVSGGTAGAAAGTLTIMTGGSPSAVERVRPILSLLGKRIYHMGGPGSGHATKAVNNFLNGITLAATAEAMIVGVKAGLDPTQLLEVLNASSGRSYATEFRFPRIIKGDYIEGGLSNRLMAKDLDVYAALAREVDVPTILGSTCRTVFSIAIGSGYGDKVSNTVVDALGDLVGGVRVQQRPPETT